MKQLLLAAMIAISTLWGVGDAYARPLTMREISQASCKITRKSTTGIVSGTGTVVKEDDSRYWILTNAHVVGTARDVKCEFFGDGYKSNPKSGTVVFRRYRGGKSIDAAVVTVSKSAFSNKKPRVIELAPRGHRLEVGDYLVGSGVPNGYGLQTWEGRITSLSNGVAEFWPAPIGGQSGTGVTVRVPDDTGEMHTRVGILLAWRVNPSVGSGMGIEHLYEILGSDNKNTGHPLPASYRPVCEACADGHIDVDKTCTRCKRALGDHALGSDNKAYCYTNGKVTFPKGVSYKGQVKDCPRCLPNPFGFLDPQNGRLINNPDVGGNPPITGSKPVPSAPSEIEILESEKQRLVLDLNAARKVASELDKRILRLEEKIQVAEREFQNLKKEYPELERFETLEQFVEHLVDKNGSLAGTIVKNEEKLKAVETALVEVKAEKEEAEESATFWSRITGAIGGGMSIFGFLWLAFRYYRAYKKGGTEGVVDLVKDRVLEKFEKGEFNDIQGDASDAVDKISDYVPVVGDRVEDWLEELVNQKAKELIGKKLLLDRDDEPKGPETVQDNRTKDTTTKVPDLITDGYDGPKRDELRM